MGILNITADSFFDGGKHNRLDAAIFQTEKMLQEGATIIDIGAQSTRPGADIIEAEKELAVAIPIIEALVKQFPQAVFSIDTFHAQVAKQAVLAGVSIINDVSAGDDDVDMFNVVVECKVPYIMMHKQGNSKTMQLKPTYSNVVLDIIDYFVPKINYLRQQGVADLIVDSGFGFGKNLAHNYELLNKLKQFEILGLPILAGMSRKKMIQKVINEEAANALNGTTVANTIALMHGANILRVHDVKEAMECVNIYNRLMGQEADN
ncbi:MAG: dihydropteroate synthase [Bacteroidota bacterium]